MTDKAKNPLNGVRRTRLAVISAMAPFLGLAFMLSQFLRSAPSVIAPDLRSELDLSAAELSSLPAALFLGSALMQLPVGILLDRFGPRRTIAGFLLISAIGTLGISISQTPITLAVALFIAGCGIAPVYMGLILMLSRWVPRDRLATASSIAVAVSGAGLLLSATPFAWASAAIGWRDTLGFVGWGAAVVAVIVFLVARDRPPGSTVAEPVPETLGQTIRGVGLILADRRLYGLAAVAAVSVGSFLTTRALWTGPYLNDVFGLDLIPRGNVIFALSLAWLVSALFYGPLDRLFDTRRGVVSAGAIAMALSFVLLTVNNNSSVVLVTGLFILLGLASAYTATIFAHARSLFPDSHTGRAITAINLFIWGGVFVVQVVTGAIVNAFPADTLGRSPVEAYQAMFGALAIALLVAVLIYRRTEDVPPSKDVGR
ncbi:MAG: MFS transporter [Alphaproteobacteria bacterium]|nr:MFS transporter [Alphaproteobacteria bacterium]